MIGIEGDREKGNEKKRGIKMLSKLIHLENPLEIVRLGRHLMVQNVRA